MARSTEDRMVHAERTSEEGCLIQVVRYDREGRWWLEWDQPPNQRTRLKTVGEAVSMVVDILDHGGTHYVGRPGGGRLDSGVAGVRRRS